MLISEAFDLYREEYLDFKVQAKRILETHEQVRKTLINCLGDKAIEDLTMHDISYWFKNVKTGRSQNTSRLYLTRIRMVIKHLEVHGETCIKSDLIQLPKRIDTVPIFLTPEEVALMIDKEPRIRNKFVISLLYSSAIRLSEFIQLNKTQIADKRFSVIGKGGKARLCFIDDRTNKLMDRYLCSRHDSSPALVVSYLNQDRMTATNVQLIIKNAARRAGIDKHVTPHTLRHSFATNFLQNNGNLRYCQVMMGHARIETTAHYSHVTDIMLEKQYQKFHSV